MKKTAIFYGSTGGNTEVVANKIAGILGAEIFDVADSPIDEFENYDNLIFGTGTTGIGDLQEDWEEFIEEVEGADLSGKTVAIFALGDSSSFSDSFVGSMHKIYEVVSEKDCNLIGFTDVDGYEFDDSDAVVDGKFVGLPIDEDNEDDLTDERIEKWIELIKSEL